MTQEEDSSTRRDEVGSALEVAHCALSSAEADLAALEKNHDAAVAEREQLEQRVELLREAVKQLEELMRSFREEADQRIATVESQRTVLESRLANAKAALEAYWSLSPHARHCDGWLSWSPRPHAPVTPADLSERFNLSIASMSGIITHALLHDRPLRDRLMDHQREYREARGPVEQKVAISKLRSSFAGEAGERIVRAALSPLAEKTSSSVRKDLLAGSYTKVDGTYEGLKVPLVLGRGEGMGAPEKGSFANEVKWGRAEYIWDQRDHMATQAEGHQHYDTSVSLCSRNFHDLPADKQQALRDTLHAAHSPLLVILPRKEELDQACIDVMMNFTVPEVDVP